MLKDAINEKHPYLRDIGKGKRVYKALTRAIVEEWDALD